MGNLQLRYNERLILSGLANKWQKIGSKGGMLYLTNQRLAFIANGFSSKIDEVPLSEIQTSGNTFHFKTSSNLISFNMTISLKSGKKIGFVVTRNQKDIWIEKIGQAILENISANISMPDMPAEVRAQVMPQIKVIDCQGCGAFVIVMSGSLAKCEYCGRPTVG